MNAAPVAPVFDIQRFSLHDGPGIRSLIFLKGCPLHCAWCQNPESQDIQPVIAFYQDRCKHSLCCESVCPEGAITQSGFRIDYERCTVCGHCVDACAYDALRRVGNNRSPQELLQNVLQDKSYFDSGGGVTLTGGEPTLYPQFVDAFLDLCKEHQIHTNIETSGLFEFRKWRPILQKLDLIYFDLKIFDPAVHQKEIGEGLARILENGASLVRLNFPVEFRLALIPGYTDTPENIQMTIEYLHSIGEKAVHLLEYHNMGELKIDLIQGGQTRLGMQNYTAQKTSEVKDIFNAAGITVLNQHCE